MFRGSVCVCAGGSVMTASTLKGVLTHAASGRMRSWCAPPARYKSCASVAQSSKQPHRASAAVKYLLSVLHFRLSLRQHELPLQWKSQRLRGGLPPQQRLQRPHHRHQEVRRRRAPQARDVPQRVRRRVPLASAGGRLHQHPSAPRGRHGPGGAAAHAAARRQSYPVLHQGLPWDHWRWVQHPAAAFVSKAFGRNLRTKKHLCRASFFKMTFFRSFTWRFVNKTEYNQQLFQESLNLWNSISS